MERGFISDSILQVLGRPKVHLESWKKRNELFGQPNSSIISVPLSNHLSREREDETQVCLMLKAAVFPPPCRGTLRYEIR